MMPTRLVSVTRLTTERFWKESLLGRSLRVIPDALRPEVRLITENTGPGRQGLSFIYNRMIEECPDDRHLVFVHDDVYLHDPFIQQRIDDGLLWNDVIGLAGSRGNLSEPSWALAFDSVLNGMGWQPLVEGVARGGAVSHCSAQHTLSRDLTPPDVMLGVYGPPTQQCDLLDGLFLAVHPPTLRLMSLRFDERFEFHLYDLDFCRSVKAAGLRLSTWPILVTHGSGGDFGSPAWKQAARTYLDKWSSSPSPPSSPSAVTGD